MILCNKEFYYGNQVVFQHLSKNTVGVEKTENDVFGFVHF